MSSTYRPYTYSYTVGPTISVQRPLTTSPTELRHLTIAAIVLTIDFILIYSGPTIYSAPVEAVYVGTAVAAALTAFLAHEMAHKVAAQRRGYWAEFRMSVIGLLVSLITAYIGFLFAAPGATMIGGMANPEDWGRTSLAGPSTNAVFGVAFLAASFGVGAAFPSEFVVIGALQFLAFINSWFGTFNMIPIGPLDGAKVMRWSKSVWIGAFLIFVALTVATGVVLYFVGP